MIGGKPEVSELLRANRRLRPKEVRSVDWANLTTLQHARLAFVYPRLSTHEQRERSVWSVERQRWLEELARLDGYEASLSKDAIEALRASPDYRGWYQNGQILVDERDLGISGTLGRQSRLGLDHLIQLIEANRVESIYTIEISRLWRDKSLTGDRRLDPRSGADRGIDVDDALRFGRLCKERDVILVLPHMRLNLSDRMHWRIYRTEAERAAEELELMQYRLGGARTMKARQGYHPGGPSIPVGYLLDTDDGSPTYHKLIPYPPHVEVVRMIFRQFVASGGSCFHVVHWCRQQGVRLTPVPEAIAKAMKGRWAFCRREPGPDGWPVTIDLVRSVIANPKYIGWWIYKGEIVSQENHPPLVNEGTFWEAVRLTVGRQPQRRGRAVAFPPPLLSGLVYCCNHGGDPRPLTNSGARGRHWYACDRDHRHGESDHQCFTVTGYILERPITDVVMRQCAYPEHTEAVLRQLDREYEQERGATAERQRRKNALRQEIATLQANGQALLTSEHYTPQRHAEVEIIIGDKKRQLQELDIAPQAVQPTLSREQVERVRRFLANIPSDWPQLSAELQREFLTRIALDRVLVRHSKEHIWCRILWRSGRAQEIIIDRPYIDERVPWAPEDEATLRRHFYDAPIPRLLELLPKRTWSGIKTHAWALGLARRKDVTGGRGISKRRWEEWEMNLLRQYYEARITKADLQEALPDRRWDIIKCKANRMGLRWVQRQPWEPRLRWEEVPDGTFQRALDATGVLFKESPSTPCPSRPG